MTYNYNPTPTDVYNAFTVAYGDLALSMALGYLYASVTDMKINEIYTHAIEKTREDMKKAGQL